MRPPRGRAPRRNARAAQGLVCTAAAAAVALTMLVKATHLLGAGSKQGGEQAASSGSSGSGGPPEDWAHPLFSRIDKELDHFKGNITLRASYGFQYPLGARPACLDACMQPSAAAERH